MSEPKLRGIHPQELGNFNIDEETGDLYWKGKRLWMTTPEQDAEAELNSTKTISRLDALLARMPANSSKDSEPK